MTEQERRILERAKARDVAGGRETKTAAEVAETVDVLKLLPGVTTGAAIPTMTVQQRLRRKFGLGQDPGRRQKLYDRVAALAAKHGDRVFTIISECVAESVGTRYPDRYFCKAVKLRLQEAGLSLVEGADTSAEW